MRVIRGAILPWEPTLPLAKEITEDNQPNHPLSVQLRQSDMFGIVIVTSFVSFRECLGCHVSLFSELRA